MKFNTTYIKAAFTGLALGETVAGTEEEEGEDNGVELEVEVCGLSESDEPESVRWNLCSRFCISVLDPNNSDKGTPILHSGHASSAMTGNAPLVFSSITLSK